MINLFNYIDRQSPIHEMTGATKLLCLIIWSLAAMTTFYTPLLFVMTLCSYMMFKISKIKIGDVSFVLGATVVFMVMNNVLIFVFSPQHGVRLYGSCTVLLPIAGRYVVTAQQLFYHLNVVLKYLCTIPVVLLFVCTTNPSEFAASLSRIGISYRISYSVALALRYIPDIQREYRDISFSMQAKGIELSSKAGVISRLKKVSGILVPLVLSSLDRIEVIANAMELRNFGKMKKRTWYMGRPFEKKDIIAIVFCMFFWAVSLGFTIYNGSRFYNPFI